MAEEESGKRTKRKGSTSISCFSKIMVDSQMKLRDFEAQKFWNIYHFLLSCNNRDLPDLIVGFKINKLAK